MKQIKNKLSLVLVIALIIGVFGNVLMASASASRSDPYYFKTKSGITINPNKVINMKKNEYQDFNLYKNGKEIKQNDKRYHLSWSSDNEDVIWVDPSNGKARADKFGTMKGEYGEAVVTAKLTNRVTKTPTYRRFKVVVGAEYKPEPTATPTPIPTPASIELQIKGLADSNQALETGYTYSLETIVYDNNNNKLDFGLHKLYFRYFCDNESITITGADFKAAKEGVYTITVGAFQTEEAAKLATSVKDAVFTSQLSKLQIKAASPKILSIRQVSLNTVKLTLNTADFAKELVKDNSLLTVECDARIYTAVAPVSIITSYEGDECSVLVQMRNRLTETYKYTYTYAGIETSAIAVVGSGTTPAAIRLIGGSVEAQSYRQFEVKVYNDRGVDISDAAYYNFLFVERDMDWTDASHQLSGDRIWFYSEGKSVVVEASLDLGYDDKGNRLPVLTSTAQFYSIPKAEPVYTNSQKFTLADEQGLFAPSSLKYSSNAQTICLGEDNLYVVAAFSYVDNMKSESIQYIASGSDTTGNSFIYTYRSADPSVLLIGETNGNLVPLQTGTTLVYIFQHSEYPIEESKGKKIATIPITVAPERALETFALTGQSPMKLSTTGNTNGDEFISFSLKALDQQGDPVDAAYSFSVIEPAATSFGALFNYSIENNTLKIWEGPGLNSIVSKDMPKNITVTVTASFNNVQKKQNFQLTVRNTKDATVFTSELYISSPRVDLKLADADLNNYINTIQVRSLDSSGYFIRLENLRYVASAADASKEKDIYSITITNSVDDTNAGNLDIDASAKTLKINLLKISENILTKAETGSYKITMYRGNGSEAVPVSTKLLDVVDTSLNLSIVQNDFSLMFADASTVKDAVTILRGSTDISEYVSFRSMKSKQVDNTLVVYEIYASISTLEQNAAWNKEYQTSVTIVPKSPLLFVLDY